MVRKKDGVEAVERQLLREIEVLTSRQFVYEDGWGGMVPFEGELGEWQTGPPVPFAELNERDQADILRSFIHWSHYPERAWDDEYTIRENITSGKLLEHWLEGTSLRHSFELLAEGKSPLPPKQPPEITQEDLAKALFSIGVAGAEKSKANADQVKASLGDDTPEPSKLQERSRGGRSM